MSKFDIVSMLILVSVGYVLIKNNGLRGGLILLLLIFVVGAIAGLVSEGYFFGDTGRYIFLIILIPIAIIVNVKKYREYFKNKINTVYKKMK